MFVREILNQLKKHTMKTIRTSTYLLLLLVSILFNKNLHAQTWISLASNDPADAYAGSGTQDAKDFYYYHTADSIWFKVVCYSDGFSSTNVDVIVLIDTDNNQSTGSPTWGGQNTSFKSDKNIVALVNGTAPSNYTGSIGIANTYAYLNSYNNVTIIADEAANSYVVGVKKADLGSIGNTMRAILMVGSGHIWNDDIPNSGSGSLVLSTGIEEKKENAMLNVFPNPTAGKFSIQIENQQQMNIEEVQVSNLLGEMVHTQKLIGSTTKMDLSDQPEGVYFVKVYSQNSLIAFKKIAIQ